MEDPLSPLRNTEAQCVSMWPLRPLRHVKPWLQSFKHPGTGPAQNQLHQLPLLLPSPCSPHSEMIGTENCIIISKFKKLTSAEQCQQEMYLHSSAAF